jgi:intracellular septation protein A
VPVGLLSILLAVFGIYAIYRGVLITGAVMLLLACCGFVGIARMYAKNYERQIAVLSGIVILMVGILTAFATENMYLRAFMLLVTLAWSFFVLLGIYNVFIKKIQPGTTK